MSNATYNRFENTLRSLLECRESLDDEDYKGCSSTEQTALNRLISLCSEISAEYGSTTINFDEDDEDDELLDEDEDEDEDEDAFEHQPPAFLFK
ncbi:hypothetical protein [Chamaesiphon sp.]|uniref:hypothetical protein n=1 Tax=Chamaesiphon sp. TaxID=2814140 RepID=UPI0035949359